MKMTLWTPALLLLSSIANASTPSDCLDLAGYMTQIRSLSDAQFMHHQLTDLALLNLDDEDAKPSDLASQRALDFFFHPNLVTLGLAAGKNGGSYLHDFTIYQLDCAKVVTGDIFAAEGMSVIWEIISHTNTSLTLKRLTKGGKAEVSPDLTVALREFKVLSPNSFTITSGYNLDTKHVCLDGKSADKESTLVQVTELFTIDASAQPPAESPSAGLQALMAHYPRKDPLGSGMRGDYAQPVTPETDAACK